MKRTLLSLFVAAVIAGCGSSTTDTTPMPGATTPIPTTPPTTAEAGPAPTYTDLFNDFFAPGKSGHCATAGCHDDPGHNEWLCGHDKETCYQGMISIGLINPNDPTHSMIADPTLSPLVWFNPSGGNMPFDAQSTPNEAGRAAIAAWVAAGAQNN